MTLFEVGVVIAIVIIGGLVFLFYFQKTHRKVTTIRCADNLTQVNLAYRLWEGDHGAVYPMGISTTNGGSMELGVAGDVAKSFQVISNELVKPGLLICPQNTSRHAASAFDKLKNKNISYLIGLDATNEANSTRVLSGDDNLESAGWPIGSGVQLFGTNNTLTWAALRHNGTGNVSFVDGSVEEVDDHGLNRILSQTGLATNRLAIP
jgi:prepilin-type processing-associated H-X9-DG protein